MLRRLIYIWMIILAATLQVAGQSYVIDEVCRGTQRTYRVEGEQTSTWEWTLKNEADAEVDLSTATIGSFSDTNSDGDPIYGSEISIPWDYDPAIYSLSVEQTSSFGCLNHELGTIEVFPAPKANAGDALTVCAGFDISITEATASNYNDLLWATDGDGTFNDPTSLNPIYTPGENDITAGSVNLILTANGLISGSGCPASQSSTELTIYPVPQLVITTPDPVCEPATVDLEDSNITNGSTLPPSTVLSYWEDAAATTNLVNFNTIATSGTYYIKAESDGGCTDIQTVDVIVNPLPIVSITDPDPVCEPNTIDLTDLNVTTGSDAGLAFTYWEDANATTELTDPNAVAITGTYYVKGRNTTTGCSDIKEVNVVINPQPLLTITNPDAKCEPETFDLSDASMITGSSIPTGSIFSYWEDIAATISLTNYSAIDISGTYYIKVVAPGGCSDIQAVDIIINPLPNLAITNPEEVCEPETINLSDSDITDGSDSGLDITYWEYIDATSVLANFNAIATSGTYYIKATNPITGCEITKPVSVVINSTPVLTITDPEPVCEPQTIDLSETSVTSGSDAGLVFTYWEDSDATIALTDYNSVASSGTFYIQATNPITGCKDIKSVNVVINAQPLLTITDPDVVCEPEMVDLSLSAITAGSDPGLVFTYWEDEDATIVLSNYTEVSTTGTYYIMATNPITSCYDIKPVDVTINPLPNLIITDPDPVCEPITIDLADGAVTAGSETGLDFTYWEDMDATVPLTEFNVVATSGTYFIKATNSLTLCETVKPVEVVINEQPDLFITNPDPVCEPTTIDLSDPAILFGSITPGSSITSYWEDSDATIALSNYTSINTSGTYYIKVEAPGGCSDIDPVEVIVNPLPNLVITDPDPICEPSTIDLTDPAIVSGSDAGMDFTYWEDIDATIALTDFNAVETSGTYYIKATIPLTGCNLIKAVQVTINEQPELIISNPAPICDTETVDLSDPATINGSTIPASSKITYWADSDTTISLTNFAAVDLPGIYYIKVEAPGKCDDIKPVEVIVNPLPNLVINNPNEVCEPETLDISHADITSGSESGLDFTYWEDEDASIALADFNAIAISGTYYIKATNPTTGCVKVEQVTVNINPIPNLVTNDPEAICEPGTIDLTEASITSGSESGLDFTYWTDKDATIALADADAVSTSGTYYIKAINPTTSCEIIDSVAVVINQVPILVITNPDPVCEPETIDLTNSTVVDGSTIPAASTISYWENASATISITDPENISQTGTYFIKILAGTDCYDIQPVNVIVNKQPILVITDPDPVCEPATVDLSASSVTSGSNTDIPLTYWKDEEATIPLDDYNAIASSGTYYIKATKDGLCPEIKPVNVSINTPPELTINNPAEVCEPTVIDLTDASIIAGSTYPPSATFTYWKDIAATQAVTNPSQVDQSGTYYIKVVAGNNCFDIKAVDIVVHPQPVLTIINPDAVCDPEIIDLTDGAITPAIDPSLIKTYWNDAFASNEISSPTAISVSGTYYIKVTNANNCDNIKPVQVIINKPDELVFNMNTQYCLNSIAPALPATAQGGITGTWAPATISTDVIGDFSYTFTPDPDQCAVPNTVQITITDQIVPEFDPMGPYYLNSSSPTLPTVSKNGISGSWNQTTISTNATGSYDYTFTPNANQCAAEQTISVLILPPVEITANVVNNLCGGESNGEINLTASGGSGIYTYSWSNGATTEDISGLPDGTYRVTVIDASGARTDMTFRIISEDTTPPVANCYEFYKVNIGANGIYELSQADLDSISKGSYDNCNDPNDLLISVNPSRFDCSQVGQMIEYTLTVTDKNNNSDFCRHYIIVDDLFIPEISCKDATLYLDQNGSVAISNPNDLVNIIENCSIDSVIIGKDQFNCSDVGTNPVPIYVRDNNGNYSDTCFSNITVLDTIKPIVVTNNIAIVIENNEGYTILSNEIDNGSFDVCGIKSIDLSKSTFTCADLGDNEILVTVTDNSGNENSGNAIVNVTFINPEPTANDDLVQTIQNKSVTFDPFDNDTDPNGIIDIRSFDITVAPENGTVEWDNDSLIYTPHKDYIGTDSFSYSVCDDGIPCEPRCDEAVVNIIVHIPNIAPIARDTLYSSGCFDINGDLALNYFDPDSNTIIINTTPIISPTYGDVTINSDGTFLYEFTPPIMASDRFSYEICDDHFDSKCAQATVYIKLFIDNDCDNVDDEIDIDDDNDGITDIEEGDMSIDTDNDLIPNSLDIDSDNDGIVDNIEGQRTRDHIDPWGEDENQNGLDDAYETNGLGIIPYDTDGNGYPDYIDPDSDSDGVPDWIEGFDANPTDGVPETTISGSDDDQDGLDNAYDGLIGTFDGSNLSNPFGSKAPLQDFDGDGKPDWRDSDDENDDILTRFEDLNNNGDYTDDDEDGDNQPEYLDFGNKCTLFIPEGFSPDGDGIHDYFQILCIQKFTNATFMVFDRLGNMIYEHEHYGNMEHWGSESEAWWDGTMNRHNDRPGQMVVPEVYMYILELGNGTRERGFVMVSY